MSDLIRTATEIATSAIDGPTLEVAQKVIADAGGFVVKTTGQIVIGGLVKRGYEKLFEEYQRRKRDGKIPDDFEKTDHGAKLLQEALEAMSRGLDESQADAVRRVFLGLAMNSPINALQRVQQVSLLETAAALTPWEIASLNLLQRLSAKLFDENAEAAYLAISSDNDKGLYKQNLQRQSKPFLPFLDEFTNGESDYKNALYDAFESLIQKKIIELVHNRTEIANAKVDSFIFSRRHWLSAFGWKLVTHLYEAESE